MLPIDAEVMQDLQVGLISVLGLSKQCKTAR